jgi:peptide-methionine (R)-S-oxide reductase
MPISRRELLQGSLLVSALALTGGWGVIGRAAAAEPFRLTDAEWRKRLSPEAYNVLRKSATEYPNSSPLLREHRAGTFQCAGCALPLFSSRTKFESGTGWPSFWQPLQGAIRTRSDNELGYTRTEVHCARCNGHLGHVFDDGPKPTGLRYCMNGVALKFVPA